jgi:hypothetical protein
LALQTPAKPDRTRAATKTLNKKTREKKP